MKLIANLALATAILSSGISFGAGSPNCDVGGKKIHVKNKAACEKKKGQFEAASDEKAAAKSDKPTHSEAGETKSESPSSEPAK